MDRRVRDGTWLRETSALEVLAPLGVGLGVLLLTLAQWGTETGGLVRGLSLGIATGVLVWAVIRRRRQQEAAIRERLLERRLEIARDLHDTVASKVAAIGLQAAAAGRVIERDPVAARVALGQVEEAARGANADLRRMLEVLRSPDDPPLRSEPDLADVPELVESFRQAGLDVTLTMAPTLPASVPDRAVGQATYRIVQEALTNAARHAAGGHVDAEVTILGSSLLVRVTNTAGHAGDPGGGPGFGLRGMRERVDAFGGDLETGPTPDGGFEVRARLPFTTGQQVVSG